MLLIRQSTDYARAWVAMTLTCATGGYVPESPSKLMNYRKQLAEPYLMKCATTKICKIVLWFIQKCKIVLLFIQKFNKKYLCQSLPKFESFRIGPRYERHSSLQAPCGVKSLPSFRHSVICLAAFIKTCFQIVNFNKA